VASESPLLQDHPGVVGILDTGELSDGDPYIVIQYVGGMTLPDAIKAKPEAKDTLCLNSRTNRRVLRL
jgi:hypothetical protein